MLNSLISRGPAGGDLPREGWESLESRPPPFTRPTLPSSLQPFFRHPFHPARFVNSEIYSKRDRNVYGRGDRFVSSSLPPLSPRGAWILGSTLALSRIQNSRHRVAQKEGGGRGRRRWSKHSPFSSRGLEYSAVLLSDETDSKKI